MKIRVERFYDDGDATLSRVSVDGVPFGYGLEDERRDVKVPGETCIPAGTYHVKVRTFGEFNAKYGARFEWHRGMLEIAGVPGFTDVLIHVGNDDGDTAGCLLVGDNYQTRPQCFIGNSAMAYERLYRAVIDAALDDELTIEIVDAMEPIPRDAA